MTGTDDTPLHTTVLSDQGPPLIFCHGLFGQGRNWTTIGKAFTDTHAVTLVDLPNHGQSPWTETVDLAADADRLVAQFADAGPLTLVGHSMGGKVAMLAALRHPDRVERLVVVDIAPVTYGHSEEFAGYIEGMLALDTDALESRADADVALQDAVPSDFVRGFLLQSLRRTSDGWGWRLNLPVLRDRLENVSDWPEEWSEHEAYPGQVLWIAGGDSGYVKDEYAPAMEALFPGVRRVSIKGGGHYVHSQKPDIFTEVLRRFLGSPVR